MVCVDGQKYTGSNVTLGGGGWGWEGTDIVEDVCASCYPSTTHGIQGSSSSHLHLLLLLVWGVST